MENYINHVKEFQSLYSALIGAFALFFTFTLTVIITFKFHKSDKLAEQRLNVYLDLTEKYMDFLVYLELSSQGVYLDQKDNEKDVMRKYKSILITYNKFSLIASSSTKKKSLPLMDGLQKVYEKAKSLDTKDQKSVFLFINALKAVEDEGIRFSWVMRHELNVHTDLKIEQNLI